MKRAIIFLLLMLSLRGFAQTKTFTLRAGLGGGSRAFINDGGKLFDLNILGDKRHTTGPLMLEGFYNINRFKVGASLLYERNAVERYYGDFFGGNPGAGQGTYKLRTTHNYTVLFGGYYSFIQKKRSSFYTGAAIGPAFTNTTDYIENTTKNSTQLGYQLTAFGYEYHNKIGLFIEAGYGYKGVLCAGLQFNIGQP